RDRRPLLRTLLRETITLDGHEAYVRYAALVLFSDSRQLDRARRLAAASVQSHCFGPSHHRQRFANYGAIAELRGLGQRLLYSGRYSRRRRLDRIDGYFDPGPDCRAN